MADLKMPELNRTYLAGRITRDPELAYVGQKSTAVAKWGIVVSRRFKQVAGDYREETSFFDCQAWGKLAEFMAKQKKGTPLIVEGSLKQDTWETKEGQKRSKVIINVESAQTLAWAPRNEESVPEPLDEEPNDEELPF